MPEPFNALSKGQGPSDKAIYRYYRSLTDSCEQIWLKVNEADAALAPYLDPKDARNDGQIPWSALSARYSMRLLTDEQALLDRVGKSIWVLPAPDSSALRALDKERDKARTLSDHEPVELLRVMPGAHIVDGAMQSSIELMVKTASGEVLYAPFIPDRWALRDPFAQSGIKPRHIGPIKQGRLHYQMSLDEVMLAWGRPERIRRLGVYQDPARSGIFIDDEALGEGLINHSKRFGQAAGNPIGHFSKVYYPHRLGPEGFLMFNTEQLLLEHEQSMPASAPGLHPKPVGRAITR